jgi:hypothetical protein
MIERVSLPVGVFLLPSKPTACPRAEILKPLASASTLSGRSQVLRAVRKEKVGRRESMRVQDLPPEPYRVFQDEASGEYIAEFQEIRGLSGIGETAPEAIGELREALVGWLEVFEE